jgi:hypothetical protein
LESTAAKSPEILENKLILLKLSHENAALYAFSNKSCQKFKTAPDFGVENLKHAIIFAEFGLAML